MNEVVRPKITELDKFSMFTSAPGAEGKRSRLAWSVRDGNPRISVFTNIPTDTANYGIINAPLNPETFALFLDMFEKVATSAGEVKYKIDNLTGQYENDKLVGKTKLSELWFGKDDKGIVWISVLADNRPKIKFEFAISDYHKVFKGDGTPFSEAESSTLQALAVIKTLRAVYVTFMAGLRQPKIDSNKNKSFSNASAGSTGSAAMPKEFEDVRF